MDPNFQEILREQRRLDETVIANLMDEKVGYVTPSNHGIVNWKE